MLLFVKYDSRKFKSDKNVTKISDNKNVIKICLFLVLMMLILII